MLAGVLSYGALALTVIFAAVALWKGEGFLMEKEKMAVDPATDLPIRLTDNAPKEGDEMLKAYQFAKPLTEDEIEELKGGSE